MRLWASHVAMQSRLTKQQDISVTDPVRWVEVALSLLAESTLRVLTSPPLIAPCTAPWIRQKRGVDVACQHPPQRALASANYTSSRITTYILQRRHSRKQQITSFHAHDPLRRHIHWW